MADIEVIERRTVSVKYLAARCGVRYWEDAEVNGVKDEDGSLIPCRDGDDWCPVIDIDTGIVQGWPEGTTADIHYKVCDDGEYALRDYAGDTVKRIEGYVPKIMCPGDNGYGDYVIMQIDGSGKIHGWVAALGAFQDEKS